MHTSSDCLHSCFVSWNRLPHDADLLQPPRVEGMPPPTIFRSSEYVNSCCRDEASLEMLAITMSLEEDKRLEGVDKCDYGDWEYDDEMRPDGSQSAGGTPLLVGRPPGGLASAWVIPYTSECHSERREQVPHVPSLPSSSLLGIHGLSVILSVLD